MKDNIFVTQIKLLPNSMVLITYNNGRHKKRKARGILFKPSMITAIKGGWKKETRRNNNRYGIKGDILYIKEKVDGIKSALFMPREKAEVWLEQTQDPYQERLGDISELGAMREGIIYINHRDGYPGFNIQELAEQGSIYCYHTAQEAFRQLWISIHGSYEKDKVLWVVPFRKIYEGNAIKWKNGT